MKTELSIAGKEKVAREDDKILFAFETMLREEGRNSYHPIEFEGFKKGFRMSARLAAYKGRPLESDDVVRVVSGQGKGWTGVVNRVDGDRVNVFISQNNPAGIGVWFGIHELKRIGRVSKKRGFQW